MWFITLVGYGEIWGHNLSTEHFDNKQDFENTLENTLESCFSSELEYTVELSDGKAEKYLDGRFSENHTVMIYGKALE